MPDLGEYHIWIQDEATKQVEFESVFFYLKVLFLDNSHIDKDA
jgi:hypothetical protein